MVAEELDQDLAALDDSISLVLARECDRRALHAFVNGARPLATHMWMLAADLGWLGVGLPVTRGGMGLGARGWATLHRCLGAYLVPGPFIATLSACSALAHASEDSFLSECLTKAMTGELKLCVPAMPSPATAPLVFESGRIRGQTPMLLGSSSATLLLAPAMRQDGTRIWALMKIATEESQAKTWTTWDRTRDLLGFYFEDVSPVWVAEQPALAAQIEDALETQMSLAIAFDSLGAAASILGQTIGYMSERVQFGRAIASFQALKHRIANLKVDMEVARVAAEQAAGLAQAEKPAARIWAKLAKERASETFARVAAECVQLHGGVGHTWEFDPHIFLKRSRLNLQLGVPNANALDSAATAFATAAHAGNSAMELPI